MITLRNFWKVAGTFTLFKLYMNMQFEFLTNVQLYIGFCSKDWQYNFQDWSLKSSCWLRCSSNGRYGWYKIKPDWLWLQQYIDSDDFTDCAVEFDVVVLT